MSCSRTLGCIVIGVSLTGGAACQGAEDPAASLQATQSDSDSRDDEGDGWNATLSTPNGVEGRLEVRCNPMDHRLAWIRWNGKRTEASHGSGPTALFSDTARTSTRETAFPRIVQVWKDTKPLRLVVDWGVSADGVGRQTATYQVDESSRGRGGCGVDSTSPKGELTQSTYCKKTTFDDCVASGGGDLCVRENCVPDHPNQWRKDPVERDASGKALPRAWGCHSPNLLMECLKRTGKNDGTSCIKGAGLCFPIR